MNGQHREVNACRCVALIYFAAVHACRDESETAGSSPFAHSTKRPALSLYSSHFTQRVLRHTQVRTRAADRRACRVVQTKRRERPTQALQRARNIEAVVSRTTGRRRGKELGCVLCVCVIYTDRGARTSAAFYRHWRRARAPASLGNETDLTTAAKGERVTNTQWGRIGTTIFGVVHRTHSANEYRRARLHTFFFRSKWL